MLIGNLVKRYQNLEQVLPRRWRLPVRYHVQSALGMLEPEFALLPKLVRPDAVSLDIGANKGVYTYRLASLCEKVVAFEPQPGCIEVLEAWRPGNVVLNQVALSDQAGTLVMYVPEQNGRLITTRASFSKPDGPSQQLPVPIRTLDSYELHNVGFIKIDVEGHESALLAGAIQTLRREQPILLIEVDWQHHDIQSWQRFFKQIRALGYAVQCIVESKLHSVEASFPDPTGKRDTVNFLFRPG